MTDKKTGRGMLFERRARFTVLAALCIAIGLYTPGVPGALLTLAGAIYMANLAINLFRR